MSSEDADKWREKIREFYGIHERQPRSETSIPTASTPKTDRNPMEKTASPDDTSTAPKRIIRAFLCHAAEDKTAVRDLYRRLKQDGFRPWLDEEDLFPGQEWEYEVTKAVRGSDVILVCLSRRSTSKTGFVQRELRFALDLADERPEGTIFIIPCRLEDCPIPTRLKVWHWVNLFEETGYSRLTRSLELLSANDTKV